MRRVMIMGVVVTIMFALGQQQARAGVRAGTNTRGDYRSVGVTRQNPDRDTPRSAWAGSGRVVRRSVLNPHGDDRGDLWPTIEESSISPHNPWVVWSRHDGLNYDLVWSRWTRDGWTPVTPVGHKQEADFGDDVDADMEFDRNGRPYIVWWRDENGTGRVLLSLYLDSRWMHPFDVSLPGANARHPTVERIRGRQVLVRYEIQHPDGSSDLVESWVYFAKPVTITDDINPLVHLEAQVPTLVP